jgi:hypothetical protein
MKTITIIGAGQLGSRHLQALAAIKEAITIQVVDASEDALKTAAIRFNEVSAAFTGEISYHTSLSELKKEIAVAIVATNSKVRRAVVEELTAHSNVKNLILEKFLFPVAADYSVIEKLITDKKVNTWVNCPRRMMSFYQQLQQELKGPIHFSMIGSAWGLGCNGIHFLDLFAFLTKTTTITLSHQLIDKKIIESKRPGYVEFTGTITGYAGASTFHITSFAQQQPSQLVINSETARYTIMEGAVSKVRKSTAENSWKEEELTFNMPFQSSLTTTLVEQLLQTGTCELTPYQESAALHLIFLNNLISFLQIETHTNTINECLIT